MPAANRLLYNTKLISLHVINIYMNLDKLNCVSIMEQNIDIKY